MSRRHRRFGRDEVSRQRRRTPPGAPPGTLSVDPHAPHPQIKVMAFGPQGLVEREPSDVDQIPELLGRYPVTWINVDGLGDANVLRRLGELFHIHPLALEDVINVHQRAKLEHYPDHQFLVFHQIELSEKLQTEQISLFFGKNFVLTFQEDAGDCLDPIRERIRNVVGLLRTLGPDYLAYAILDASVDHYFPVLEQFGELLEDLEQQIISSPETTTMAEIHEIKRRLLTLRRKIWPLRDALNTLVRDPVPHVTDLTRVYLRDCYDHVMRVIDLLEMYRELASDLLEFQLSSVSHKINEVMRLLTVIATIFIPLTFIAGVYGMNFDTSVSPWNMPELKWKYGYPLVIALMAAVAVGLLYFFYRRGWLGQPRGKKTRSEIACDD
jgi:magnesium transporter